MRRLRRGGAVVVNDEFGDGALGVRERGDKVDEVQSDFWRGLRERGR